MPCVMDLCGTEMISGDVFADHNFHHEARQIRSRGAEERLGHESVPTLFFREVENAEEHLNPVMLLQSEVREVQLVLDSVRREFEELKGEQNSRAAIVTEVQHCRTCEEGAEAAIRELRREVDSLTVSRDLHVRNEKGLIEMRRELITLLKQKQGSASTGYENLESDVKELLAEHLQERRKFADQKEWWESSTKYAFAQMEIELKNLLDQQRMELVTFSDEVRKVLNEGGVVSRLEELEAQCCAERSSRMAMEEDFRALLEDQSREATANFHECELQAKTAKSERLELGVQVQELKHHHASYVETQAVLTSCKQIGEWVAEMIGEINSFKNEKFNADGAQTTHQHKTPRHLEEDLEEVRATQKVLQEELADLNGRTAALEIRMCSSTRSDDSELTIWGDAAQETPSLTSLGSSPDAKMDISTLAVCFESSQPTRDMSPDSSTKSIDTSLSFETSHLSAGHPLKSTDSSLTSDVTLALGDRIPCGDLSCITDIASPRAAAISSEEPISGSLAAITEDLLHQLGSVEIELAHYKAELAITDVDEADHGSGHSVSDLCLSIEELRTQLDTRSIDPAVAARLEDLIATAKRTLVCQFSQGEKPPTHGSASPHFGSLNKASIDALQAIIDAPEPRRLAETTSKRDIQTSRCGQGAGMVLSKPQLSVRGPRRSSSADVLQTDGCQADCSTNVPGKLPTSEGYSFSCPGLPLAWQKVRHVSPLRSASRPRLPPSSVRLPSPQLRLSTSLSQQGLRPQVQSRCVDRSRSTDKRRSMSPGQVGALPPSTTVFCCWDEHAAAHPLCRSVSSGILPPPTLVLPSCGNNASGTRSVRKQPAH